jgi:hypothetical protein
MQDCNFEIERYSFTFSQFFIERGILLALLLPHLLVVEHGLLVQHCRLVLLFGFRFKLKCPDSNPPKEVKKVTFCKFHKVFLVIKFPALQFTWVRPQGFSGTASATELVLGFRCRRLVNIQDMLQSRPK